MLFVEMWRALGDMALGHITDALFAAIRGGKTGRRAGNLHTMQGLTAKNALHRLVKSETSPSITTNIVLATQVLTQGVTPIGWQFHLIPPSRGTRLFIPCRVMTGSQTRRIVVSTRPSSKAQICCDIRQFLGLPPILPLRREVWGPREPLSPKNDTPGSQTVLLDKCRADGL